VDRHPDSFRRLYHQLSDIVASESGVRQIPETTAEFLDYAKAMKANRTPGGMSLGHATGDANTWVYWCLWTHGGNTVDENDKVIINSPETEKALVFAKQLYEQMVPGVLSWNDASNNKAFLGREIHWTNNTISIYAAAKRDPNLKDIAEDMDHAYWPVGPVGTRPNTCRIRAAGDGLYEISAGVQSAVGVPYGGGSVQQMAHCIPGLRQPHPQCVRQQPSMD